MSALVIRSGGVKGQRYSVDINHWELVRIAYWITCTWKGTNKTALDTSSRNHWTCVGRGGWSTCFTRSQITCPNLAHRSELGIHLSMDSADQLVMLWNGMKFNSELVQVVSLTPRPHPTVWYPRNSISWWEKATDDKAKCCSFPVEIFPHPNNAIYL